MENTINISTNGFDNPKYTFPTASIKTPVVFQLMPGLDQATIHIELILKRGETEKKTVCLEVGNYIVSLPPDKNAGISPSGTNSGTIDVSSTPMP